MISCIICHHQAKPIYRNLFDDRYGAIGKHTIYRCISCSFVRTIPGIPKDKISRFYSKYYPLLSVDPTLLKKSINIPSKVLLWLKGNDNTAHFHIKPFSTVLDIGSGTGLSLLEIGKIGGKAYGVEPDPNAQRIAKKLHLSVYQGFITDVSFSKFKFDYVTASQVIEHDPDPVAFLKKAKEKLNKNGKIILSFPNVDSIYRKIFGRRWINWHVPYHLSFLTKKSLKIVADRAGLKIVKIRTITPNLWTVLQLRMLISPICEGHPNPIWVNRTKMTINKNDDRNIRTVFLKRSLLLVIFFFSFVNRIIDLLGWGDSYLVFLKIKNEKR